MRRIPCEGSGQAVNERWSLTMCKMCGVDVTTDDNGLAVAHDRDDVLRAIDDGEFG